jgi:hypothetical protein
MKDGQWPDAENMFPAEEMVAVRMRVKITALVNDP